MEFGVEKRVGNLERLVGQFVRQTNKAFLRMERGIESLQIEMKNFKDEMLDYKELTQRNIDRIDADRIKMNKQWGNLANKMGTMVEDLIYPSLSRIIVEQFGLEVEYLAILVKKRIEDGSRKEWDAIALAGELVF